MNREKLAVLRKSADALPWDAPVVALTLLDLLDALLEGAPDVGAVERINWRTFDDAIGTLGGRLTRLEAQMRERALTWDLNAFAKNMTQLDQALLAHSDRLTFLEGAMDARVAEADAGAARRARVDEVRTRWATHLQVSVSGSALVQLLDALLGPPDVGLSPDTRDEAFRAKMRSGQAWTTESPDVIAQAMGLIVRARSRLLGDGTTVISDARILLHEALDLLHPGMSRPVTRGATPCPVCETYVCMGDVDARACDQRAAARKAIQP